MTNLPYSTDHTEQDGPGPHSADTGYNAPDERFDGFSGLASITAEERAQVEQLIAAVERDDTDAIECLSLMQVDRLDGDSCGWRSHLAEWAL